MNRRRTSTGRSDRRPLLRRLSPGLLALLLAAAGCRPAEPPAELVEFESAFRAANQAPATDAMRALYYLDGAPETVLDQLDFTLEYELGLPLREIRFRRIRDLPVESPAVGRDGRPYRPNLRPEYEMHVIYDLPEQPMASTYRLGRDPEGDWRILLLVPAGGAK